ncbi:MAG TPA: ABC transporter permease, partial [Blastocatellia bacterium]|nr:ABC transporter permease [Blastocatellia bacterium]
RYGLRMLLKRPGFTLIAVLTLALGIGANTAIFSVVNAVLLRPLPYAQPERLVFAFRMQPPIQRGPISRPDFLEWQAQNQSFQNLAAYTFGTFNLTGVDQAERLRGALVSEDFFPLFGVNAARGRFLLPSDNQPGSPRVTVISYGVWQRRFGGDPGIVGQSVALNGDSYTVVGVTPKEFNFPGATDAWMPANLPESQQARGSNYLLGVGRLKDGVTVEQARAQLNQIAAGLAEQFPQNDSNLSFLVSPLLDLQVRFIRPILWIMLGAVGFVLLIACANVANLLLARAMARQKEMAIRTAMGASRWHIVRQLLTESMLLAILGGGLGILLAVWAVDLLVAFAPSNIPRVREVNVDRWVLGFTMLVSLVTGVLFGLAPAMQVSKSDLNETLKEGGRSAATTSPRQALLRRGLVVFEMASSLVLLICAALLIVSIQRLTKVDPGFDPKPLLTADVSFPRQPASPGDKPADALAKQLKATTGFLTQVEQRVRQLPGVEAVGAINDLPVTGRSSVNGGFSIVGQPPWEPGKTPVAEYRTVTNDYFRALGVPLIKGRAFNDSDKLDSTPVVVINETMAKLYFPGEDPIGKQVSALTASPSQVVGVVGDARQWGLELPPAAEIYFPYSQAAINPETSLVVRAGGDPARLSDAVRDIVREVNPDAPMLRVKTMSDILALSTAQQRFTMTLMAVFAGVALVMSIIGLYGVMSYSVTQRTHEIGIRMALGAERRDVMRLVVGQGFTLAVIGVGTGLVAAIVSTRLLATLLFGVSAKDPLTFAAVSLIMLVVALGACYVPARRATKVDPMVALRYE